MRRIVLVKIPTKLGEGISVVLSLLVLYSHLKLSERVHVYVRSSFFSCAPFAPWKGSPFAVECLSEPSLPGAVPADVTGVMLHS